MKKQVKIMRGISGAGKSTYVKNNYPHAIVCSADSHFMKDGVYKFNPKELNNAHNSCFVKFRDAVTNSEPLVIVDNTNTRIWEFEKYLQLAKELGYSVEVIRLNPDCSLAASRNVHGVPQHAVESMYIRMEPFDGEKVLVSY
jgi:predicted kinase